MRRLFYTSSDGYLYASTWVPADNPVTCPSCILQNAPCWGGSNDVDISRPHDTTTAVNDIIQSRSSINIFPNPSENSFTISLNNPSSNSNCGINIQIEDLNGRVVYQLRDQIAKDTWQTIWHADNVSNGIYIYSIKVGDTFFAGKLIKM